MESRDKMTVWLTGIVCTSIILFVTSIILCWNARTKLFVENNYTRKTLIGHDVPQWVKINEKENKDAR